MSMEFALSFGKNPLRTLRIEVPPLPRTVRYVDDYTDQDHSVNDPSASTWRISNNGSQANLRFERYNSDFNLQRLIQAFAADLLTRSAVSTTRLYVDNLSKIELFDMALNPCPRRRRALSRTRLTLCDGRVAVTWTDLSNACQQTNDNELCSPPRYSGLTLLLPRVRCN